LRFLLDTNVLSELRKMAPSPKVLDWFGSIPNEHLFISSITLGEISHGINKLPEGGKRNDLIVWFDKMEESFRYQIYCIDREVAIKWGELMADSAKSGIKLPVVDGLIAATAYIHGAILVTRNAKDFESVPIQILNPWL